MPDPHMSCQAALTAGPAEHISKTVTFTLHHTHNKHTKQVRSVWTCIGRPVGTRSMPHARGSSGNAGAQRVIPVCSPGGRNSKRCLRFRQESISLIVVQHFPPASGAQGKQGQRCAGKKQRRRAARSPGPLRDSYESRCSSPSKQTFFGSLT